MKMNNKVLLLVLGCMFGACSPKISDVKSPETTEPKVTDPIKQEPKGPCTSFADLPGHDKEIAETAFVLYKDFLKMKNYKEAYVHWKIAYNMAPGSNGRVKSHFEDANQLKQSIERLTDI